MGRYQITDAYKIYPEVGYYATGSCYAYQNAPLYNRLTSYDLYIAYAQNAGSYVILEWILTDATYGDIC